MLDSRARYMGAQTAGCYPFLRSAGSCTECNLNTHAYILPTAPFHQKPPSMQSCGSGNACGPAPPAEGTQQSSPILPPVSASSSLSAHHHHHPPRAATPGQCCTSAWPLPPSPAGLCCPRGRCQPAWPAASFRHARQLTVRPWTHGSPMAQSHCVEDQACRPMRPRPPHDAHHCASEW